MRPVKVEAGVVADALVEAFRRDGYAGASLRDLAAATGLNPASLYHRFAAGKPDMALAALDHAGARFGALVVTPLATPGPPADRLAASARGLTDFYAGSESACLLAVLALADAPERVRDAVAALLAGWRAALAATLAEAGLPAPEAAADDRIAAIQGALIVRRAGLDPAVFTRAVARMGVLP